jgi:predicted MFS family arabinose efflux permease
MYYLTKTRACLVFVAFASAYFMSAALRTVTATLAPTLTTEFNLQARDLGLLSGGYFLGFAVLQIPLGGWLDRFGPKRVIVTMLSIAVLGCWVFQSASSFHGLLLARFLSGLGVSVCLMAPLTAYRRWLKPETQLRANSWMLMSGSLGMLAATLPVQTALPLLGWRGIFGVLALLVFATMVLIVFLVPTWQTDRQRPQGEGVQYAIWSNPYFSRMVPIGFVVYGGMIAIQTLWAGPWMTRVAGYSSAQAAGGLFAINLAMLLSYWVWGWLNPQLAARGWDAVRLMKIGLPISLGALPLVILVATDRTLGGVISLPIWLMWIVYFVASSFVSLAQPAVGMAFPQAMAGRALTAYNLVIFMGVFTMQWGLGLTIDLFQWLGLDVTHAFQAAFGVFWLLCVGSCVHFWMAQSKESKSR